MIWEIALPAGGKQGQGFCKRSENKACSFHTELAREQSDSVTMLSGMDSSVSAEEKSCHE